MADKYYAILQENLSMYKLKRIRGLTIPVGMEPGY